MSMCKNILLGTGFKFSFWMWCKTSPLRRRPRGPEPRIAIGDSPYLTSKFLTAGPNVLKYKIQNQNEIRAVCNYFQHKIHTWLVWNFSYPGALSSRLHNSVWEDSLVFHLQLLVYQNKLHFSNLLLVLPEAQWATLLARHVNHLQSKNAKSFIKYII